MDTNQKIALCQANYLIFFHLICFVETSFYKIQIFSFYTEQPSLSVKEQGRLIKWGEIGDKKRRI